MINVGVIGYGYWGPNLVRNFAEIAETRMVAVCDQEEERLEEAARRYPTLETYSSVGTMLAEADIEAVAIATPVGTHHELALEALRAGKHVLVEKPLAISTAQAEELVREAEQRGLVLLVDHTFVYTGAVRKIRDLIASGALGQLYYYDSVRVNLGLFQSDVSVLWDLAVHDLSILDAVWPAKPVAVSAHSIAHIEGQHPNQAYLTLGFEEQMIAHMHVNWLSPVKVRHTLIGGSEKMILFNDLEPNEKIRVYDDGVDLHDHTDGESVRRMLAYRRTGDVSIPKIVLTEALETEAKHFAACIAGKANPLTGGDCGLRIVRILEAADKSMAGGGGWVDLAP